MHFLKVFHTAPSLIKPLDHILNLTPQFIYASSSPSPPPLHPTSTLAS